MRVQRTIAFYSSTDAGTEWTDRDHDAYLKAVGARLRSVYGKRFAITVEKTDGRSRATVDGDPGNDLAHDVMTLAQEVWNEATFWPKARAGRFPRG